MFEEMIKEMKELERKIEALEKVDPKTAAQLERLYNKMCDDLEEELEDLTEGT